MAYLRQTCGKEYFHAILAFTLGFLLSYVYFSFTSDEVRIYQSFGVRDSVRQTLSSRQRLTRFSGNDGPGISRKQTKPTQRKILLDCGANTASTVELFRETYPGGRDFIIHSFEIDDRLAPYFAPYANHVLHCPMAVSDKNGTLVAYSESSWSPDKGLNNGRDMQWGGGTLFVDDDEKRNTATGGRRKLSVRTKIPTVDFSDWIRKHTNKEDYVIFKLDVEGAEYGILDKMMKDGTFAWIDKFYGEYHPGRPTDHSRISQAMTRLNVEVRGKPMLTWAGETKTYEDFDVMHPTSTTKVFRTAGVIKDKCQTRNRLSIVLLMSMDAKVAQKIVAIIKAYRKKLPITMFLYGDFLELFPETVSSWSAVDNFHIGLRESQQFPPGHVETMGANWIRETVVSSQLRISELQIANSYYFPAGVSENVVSVSKSLGLTVIQPSAAFPPIKDDVLTYANYYKYRDVERIPKALRLIHEQLLTSSGGILTLDTTLPDTHLIIVFLLDYLIDNSGYEIVPLDKCI